MKDMEKEILKANSNTVLLLFKGRCALNPSHKATVIHHIIPRLTIENPHRIENLIPLCAECHVKIHREGTKKYRSILQSKHESFK